jgi:hypothetical protein
LSEEVIKVIKALSSHEIGGKSFLKLCLGILRAQDSAVIAKLTQELITTEDLANYVVIGEKVIISDISEAEL